MAIAKREKIIRLLISIWLILFSSSLAFSQDSGSTQYREVPQEQIDELLQDEDLNYPLEVGENAGWFQKIFEWIVAGLNWFYELLGRGGLSREFLYLISFIAAGILVWLLLRSRYSWVFAGRSREGKIDYSVHHEDIHTIDFDEQIERALKEEDYRLAVRLVYLRTLKLMSDYHLIRWAQGKTNNQYSRELKNDQIKSQFSELSYQFNYLWYGHFDANNQHWESANDLYQELSKSIKS